MDRNINQYLVRNVAANVIGEINQIWGDIIRGR